MNTDAQIVSDVFCEVLEAFAFMFADPVPVEAEATDPIEMLHASITFTGPTEGTLSIAAPRPLCAMLAANALGADDEDSLPPEAMVDSLKELLNVTCGNILTKLFGTSPVFNLSIPVVQEAGTTGWRQVLGTSCVAAFCVDGAHTVGIGFARSQSAVLPLAGERA